MAFLLIKISLASIIYPEIKFNKVTMRLTILAIFTIISFAGTVVAMAEDTPAMIELTKKARELRKLGHHKEADNMEKIVEDLKKVEIMQQ